MKIDYTGIQTEVDASYLYSTLAAMEKDEKMAAIYRKLSETEGRHAEGWLTEMHKQWPEVKTPGPSQRARILAWTAKNISPRLVMPVLIETEKGIANALKYEKSKRGMQISGRENMHAKILEGLQSTTNGVEGSKVARYEGRHQGVGGNALRAGVLGANDGLMSNLSLIMGVAGAELNNSGILITGFAGMLAGSISMALGEWLSVTNSRELYKRQMVVEASELESSPEEEAIELSLIYQAKGIPEKQATDMARAIIENPATALDTLAREELGLDPDQLGGSAWTAAFTSFILFAIGAIIPLAPYLFAEGRNATIISLIFSAAGLFGIGSIITLLTGKNLLLSGARQLLFGFIAAGVTYTIGYLLSVSITR